VLWEYTKRMSTPLESIIEGFTNAPPPPIPNTGMDLAKARQGPHASSTETNTNNAPPTSTRVQDVSEARAPSH